VPGGTRLDPTAIIFLTDPASHLKFTSARPPPSAIPAATLSPPNTNPATVISTAETTRARKNRLVTVSGSSHALVSSRPLIKSAPAQCFGPLPGTQTPLIQKPVILAAPTIECPVCPNQAV